MTRASVAPRHLVILGHPITHSLSPYFQNAALQALGMTMRYEPRDVRPVDLPDTLRQLASTGGGGNVTMPHKEAVARQAVCSLVATRVGAVNTFWFDGGTLMGHNTDVEGLSAAISEVLPAGVNQLQCAVLGAGGAAAAALVTLDMLGCRRIHVAARTVTRAHALAKRVAVSVRVASSSEDACERADLIINTTPIGLTDDAMPVALTALRRHATVIDLICRPQGTELVRRCRDSGLTAVDGTTMLLAQGAASFACWFGVAPPLEVMRAALLTRYREITEQSG